MRRARSASNAEITIVVAGLGVVLVSAAVAGIVGRELSLGTLWSVVAVSLFAVAVVWALRRASASYDEPRYARLLVFAVLAKAAASVTQYFLIEVVYGGTADANRYHQYGSIVADSIRDGAFESHVYGSEETTNMVTIVGWVYAVAGSGRLGGTIVFAAMALIGAFLFDRAVRRAAPTLDLWRYSVLIYLVPAVLFWTATIGKDAWMLLMIGMVANGFSLLIASRPRWSGIAWVVLGLAGSSVIRPHVTLALVASLAIGLLFMSVPAAGQASGRRRVLQLTALALAVAGATFLVANAERYFGADLLNAGSLEEVFEAEGRTSEGTVIAIRPVNTPLDVPLAAVTVLFRPFPGEAFNVLGILASLESLVLLVLVGARLRLGVLFREMRRSPFVVFSLSYVLLFAVAFSNIENAGILVRQRGQVLPLLLVFAALPKLAATSRSVEGAPAPVPVERSRLLGHELTQGGPSST